MWREYLENSQVLVDCLSEFMKNHYLGNKSITNQPEIDLNRLTYKYFLFFSQ